MFKGFLRLNFAQLHIIRCGFDFHFISDLAIGVAESHFRKISVLQSLFMLLHLLNFITCTCYSRRYSQKNFTWMSRLFALFLLQMYCILLIRKWTFLSKAICQLFGIILWYRRIWNIYPSLLQKLSWSVIVWELIWTDLIILLLFIWQLSF